jgi:phosphatidyl-myo-inositol dimannoside synthase
MRRIVIVSSEFPPGPGGIGTHAFEIARHLHRLGWDVEVVTPQDHVDDAEADAFVDRLAFPVHRPARTGRRAVDVAQRVAAIGATIRRAQPDIVLATGAPSVATVAALRPRAPFVAVGHGTEFGHVTGRARRSVRASFGRAATTICVSEFTRRFMERAQVRCRRVVVIPNGGDDERFGPDDGAARHAVRARLGLDPATPLIVTVGNVTERKGQEVVVRALPHLPGVHFAAVGLPTDGERLQAVARELGVDDRLHLTGRAGPEAVVEAMRAADVHVLASRETDGGDVEGYGIAVVEAALCATPSVVSDLSGLIEAVEPGVTAVVSRQGDPGSLAEAIGGLVADPARRAAMGAAARARAVRDQTWAHVAERYADELEAACRPAVPEGAHR